MSNLFVPHYSPTESDRYLLEVSGMEHPKLIEGGSTPDDNRRYDEHVAQLKKYPAPWLTGKEPEVMELNVDFELEERPVNEVFPEAERMFVAIPIFESLVNKDVRIQELEEALGRAIGTIETECDDTDFINELKTIHNGTR